MLRSISPRELRPLSDDLNLDNMHCPHCGRLTDDATSVNPNQPDARPGVGDSTICSQCTGVGVYTEDSIRKATDEELSEFATHPVFRRAMMAATFASVLQTGPSQEIDIEVEGHEGAEEPHTHHATMIPVSLNPDDPALAGLPGPLQEIIASALKSIRLTTITDEITRFVTQEVANHVLSSYGNEEASMPSLTTGALISLIRLCHESDDAMMMNLNDVEDFHGYVLAVVMLAEKPGGIEMLEKLAGLRTRETDEATAGAPGR